jgi:hypothetical protein
MDVSNDSCSKFPEIAACSSLIRQALEPQKKTYDPITGLSLDFIRPRISKESLRRVGMRRAIPYST